MIPGEEVSAHAHGLKVHLRFVTVGRYTYRIVTLRPKTPARFSTNYFHDTWHILTDREGAFILARLLWGLAFQRAEGTAVLLDGCHLLPTPFEADPADPVLLVPAGLTRVDVGLFRLLKRHLRRHPIPTTTVRWQTFGLPAAIERDAPTRAWRYRETKGRSPDERVARLGGFVCYSAPPELLRSQALSIYRMRTVADTSHHYLADRNRHPDGEVQVFRDFRTMVSAAKVARRRVLGAEPRIDTAAARETIHRQTADILKRLKSH